MERKQVGIIANATIDNFDDLVLTSQRPVLVDFWADWCGPCKALAPTLDELASLYTGQVDLVKVDVVENEALRERFAARTIPLLVMFKDGAEVGRHVGNASKTRVAAFIDAHS